MAGTEVVDFIYLAGAPSTPPIPSRSTASSRGGTPRSAAPQGERRLQMVIASAPAGETTHNSSTMGKALRKIPVVLSAADHSMILDQMAERADALDHNSCRHCTRTASTSVDLTAERAVTV